MFMIFFNIRLTQLYTIAEITGNEFHHAASCCQAKFAHAFTTILTLIILLIESHWNSICNMARHEDFGYGGGETMTRKSS